MNNATTIGTSSKLQQVFAVQGMPEVVVTDNEVFFVSDKIEKFFKYNGILHRTSAPYHPAASNGLAERAVQTKSQV